MSLVFNYTFKCIRCQIAYDVNLTCSANRLISAAVKWSLQVGTLEKTLFQPVRLIVALRES